VVEEERMLVLSRKISQQIRIGSDICITVVKIDRNQVRLGIKAPLGVTILRDELVDHSNRRERTSEIDLPATSPNSAAPDRTLCTAGW
jgi:carbon storage regulator